MISGNIIAFISENHLRKHKNDGNKVYSADISTNRL